MNAGASRTRFLCRLMGLYLLAIAVTMLPQKQQYVANVTALLRDGPLLYVVGMVVLAGGLALVIAHNVWSRGAAPMLVTLLGWLTLLKGLVLVAAPSTGVALSPYATRFDEWYYGYTLAALAIGAYLTIMGFKTRSEGGLR